MEHITPNNTDVKSTCTNTHKSVQNPIYKSQISIFRSKLESKWIWPRDAGGNRILFGGC